MAEPEPHQKKRTNPLIPFIWSAAPPLIAAVALLWQFLDRYIPIQHQGLLIGIAVLCGNIPLTTWLWCKVAWLWRKIETICEEFAERNRRADERVERLQKEVYVLGEQADERHRELIKTLEKLGRSVQGLHRHLDQDDKVLEEITTEVEHLRGLVIKGDSLPSQRLGPRPLP